MKKRIAIIGGGFFGLYLSYFLGKNGHKITLFEKESEVMKRASFNNQARVHNGYHYPRSILTALRSRVSFERFSEEFKVAIDSSFKKYYLIGKILSKVTASQYLSFCKRINAPCISVRDEFTENLNWNFVEEVFLTKEYAFDANVVKEVMLNKLESVDIDLFTNAEVEKISKKYEDIELQFIYDGTKNINNFEIVFNCTYSKLNSVLFKSQLPLIPLKHEMTEMCIVDVPRALQNIGLTVMCGPFFSIMPFPALNSYSFSHVRYTPHFEWYDDQNTVEFKNYEYLRNFVSSNFNKMLFDAKRYIPILNDIKYLSSLIEVKTVLPRSENDDSRPILFKPNYANIKGFHCILGGKIDNVYDMTYEITNQGLI